MNEVFSRRAENMLRDEMCICLDDLRCHLASKVPTRLVFFKEFFDFLVELNPSHKNFELGSPEYYRNDEYLNNEILEFFRSRGIKDGTEEYFIIDSIRHAFISFKDGGLYSLYKNREAENWYPKVIIRKKIGENNLVGDVVIYRGTSKSEYKLGKFSQSWTLKEKVANEFAFKHYQIHSGYINTERVILKARINACHIYYYDETDDEQEVIIDERKINSHSLTIICQSVLESADSE